jgi:hypothetical protein
LKERNVAASVKKIVPGAAVAAVPTIRLSTPTAQLRPQPNRL